MNKKKRALALGLAATQLTALSAVVAPLTAFAEVTQGSIVTDAESIDSDAGTVTVDSENKIIKYEIKDYSKLSKTPSSPSYQSLGVKLAASDTDNLAFGNSTYSPDSANDKSANIKNDGFLFWLSGTKLSAMEITFRRYENPVTLKNGQFYTTIGSTDTAITEGTGTFSFKTGVGASGTDYVEETWKIVRIRNMTAELDKSDISGTYSTVANAKKGVENFLTVDFFENDSPLSGLEKDKDYTVTVEKKEDKLSDDADSRKTVFTVTIALNENDARLEFADTVPDFTVAADHKSITTDVEVKVGSNVENPVPVTAEFNSDKLEADGKTLKLEKPITAYAADKSLVEKVVYGDVLSIDVLKELIKVTSRAEDGTETELPYYTLSSSFDTTWHCGLTWSQVVRDNFVVDSDGNVIGVKVTLCVQVSGTHLFVAEDGNTDDNAQYKDLEIIVPAAIKDAPTAPVEIDDTALTGKDNAEITVKKGDDAFDPATDTVKSGDVLTVTVAAKDGFEFSTEPAITATNATVTGSDGTFTITVSPLEEEDEVTITVTGAVKKSANVAISAAHTGIDNPPTMDGNANLDNYRENLDKYEFTLAAGTDSDYLLTVKAQYGSMKGKTAAGADGKNALVILEMAEKDAELSVKKNGEEVDDSWKTDGHTFVDGDEEKGYVTLWISLTEARMNGSEAVEYTFKSGKVEKTLKVKFEDTTEYKLEAPDLTDAGYTVEITNPAAGKSEATITVTPTADGVITNAEVCGVKLTPNGKSYSGKVDVKAQLTSAQIEAGTTTVTLVKDSTLNINVASRSEDIKATNIAVAREAPDIEASQADRYAANRPLYANRVEWDAANFVATVKVPSALMVGSGASGQTAANICLVMTFETPLTKTAADAASPNGAWGLKATGIEDIDVEDAWKFVDGATEADKGKYAVLWIGAGSTALSGGSKIVVYSDKDGGVIATVSLADIPVITATPGVSPVTLNGATDAANKTLVEEAVKSALGASADLVTITVGTLPTETGTVEVTLTAKETDSVAFKAENGGEAANFKFNVNVTVPVKEKFDITIGTVAATDGTVTADVTEAAEGDTVTLTITPATGKAINTVTITKAGGGTVTVSGSGNNRTFVMPADDVTVTVTFKAANSGGNGGSGSSGGGSSRPSGGSSGGSSSSSTDISSDINYAAKGSTITVPNGKTTIFARELEAAKNNDVTLIVPIDSAYSWTLKPSELPSTSSFLVMSISDGPTVSQSELGKIKGEPVTDIMTFRTYANDLGKAATLTVTTPAKSTAAQTKFANLYKVNDSGALEFVTSAKIGTDGKAVLNMTESGNFALLVSNESKMPGDINNDCTLNVNDVVATIDNIMSGVMNSEGDLAKLDFNGDGKINVIDVMAEIDRIMKGN